MGNSVAFLDESGDESSKLDRGASTIFVVGLVVFANTDGATRCNDRIDALRDELGKPSRYEFHFRTNTDRVRRAFLGAIAPFGFTYHGVILEKPNGPKSRLPLYLDACALVCRLAEKELNHAVLIVDGREKNRTARRSLATSLRRHINDGFGRALVEVVRPQDSARNNLIQLADYVTGVQSWSAQGKPGAEEYRHLLHARRGTIWRGRL